MPRVNSPSILMIQGNHFALFELEKRSEGPKLIAKHCKSYSGDPRLEVEGDERTVKVLVKELLKIKKDGKIGSFLSDRKRMTYNYDKNVTYKERKKVIIIRNQLEIPVKAFPNEENDLPVKDLDDLLRFFESYMGSKLKRSNLSVKSPKQVSKQTLLSDYLSACYHQLYGNYRKSLGGLTSQNGITTQDDKNKLFKEKTATIANQKLCEDNIPCISATLTPRK